MDTKQLSNYLQTPQGKMFSNQIANQIMQGKTMDEAMLFATDYMNSFFNEIMDNKTSRAQIFTGHIAEMAIKTAKDNM